MKKYLIVILFALMMVYPCAASMVHDNTETFGQSVDLGMVEYDALNEASGIAMSRRYTNVLWSHNDSGDESRIYAMSMQGKHLDVFQLKDIEAIDWEDIACGPGPVTGTSYIYIADMGDNKAKRKIKYIYRFQEPEIRQSIPRKIHWITSFDRIAFEFPDGLRDAETLLLEPNSCDLYIVSKREEQVGIYRLKYPQSTQTVNHAEKIAILPLTWAVGGDLSPDGDELLIKTESTVYYWKKEDQASISTFFEMPNLVSVPYVQELQGEAICWFRHAMGYFTVSEEPWRIENNAAHLYFYPRLTILDINQDHQFDIADIMHCFECIAGQSALPDLPVKPDINHNDQLSIEELIYGLQALIQRVNNNH
jgi:hypothetical protein